LLLNAHDVYAGNKTVSEGLHDVLNPIFTAEEARDMTAYGRNAIDNCVANGRAAMDGRTRDTNRGQDHDGVRGMPGDAPLGVDR